MLRSSLFIYLFIFFNWDSLHEILDFRSKLTQIKTGPHTGKWNKPNVITIKK